LIASLSVYTAAAPTNADLLEGEVRYIGNFYYYPSVPNTLFLIGPIGDFEVFEQYSRASIELRRAIRNHDVRQLVLASGGGAVDIGLDYASIIHDKQIAVYVPDTAGCFSACSFMFFGGHEKHAAGPVGVHQFYSTAGKIEDKQLVQRSAQYTVGDIIYTLNSFNVPPRIYEHMFTRVGYDFYNLSQTDLEDLGSVGPQDWHLDADKIISSLAEQNSDIQYLAAFVKGEEPTVVEVTEPEKQRPSREEIVRAAFMKVQSLLNEHNCGAGTPDGIVGPKTEAAFERFVMATGVSIDFDAENAFEQVIKALESHKRPACGMLEPQPVPKLAPKQPSEKETTSLVGEWAVLSRCFVDGKRKVSRGQLSLNNPRKYGYNQIYDGLFVAENRDQYFGEVRQLGGILGRGIDAYLSAHASNFGYKGVLSIKGAELTKNYDTIVVERQDILSASASDGACTMEVYRIKY